VTATLTSDDDGYAIVDVDDSKEEYDTGKNATYNYTVSIYEDDDDLSLKVDDYSTAEDSKNISKLLKRATDYMEASEYELADAYEAYYEAKAKLNEELGDFKQAIVYAEDVYVKLINYDSDSDNYKSQTITYRSSTTAEEKVQQAEEEAEAEEAEESSTNSTSTSSSSSSSSSSSNKKKGTSDTKVQKDYDDEDRKESYSVSAYKKGKKNKREDDDETSSKYYVIDDDTSVEVSSFIETPMTRLLTSFVEVESDKLGFLA